MEAADGGAGVLIGCGGDRASVEDYDSCVVGFGGAFQALLLELAFNRGAICLGCAAAKIFHVESRHAFILA